MSTLLATIMHYDVFWYIAGLFRIRFLSRRSLQSSYRRCSNLHLSLI